MRVSSRLRATCGLLCLGWATAVPAADWPQHLGPNRDGTHPAAAGESNLDWRTAPPKKLWEVPVGAGFAGPAAAGGEVFLFHRVEDEEVLSVLDAATGKERRRGAYPTDYQDQFGFDGGPRAIPLVLPEVVVTFGAAGRLTAWDRGTCKRRWSVPTHAKYGVRQGFFGAACSPLRFEDKILVEVGGRDGQVVAFRLADGSEAWKYGTDEAGYSSPVLTTLAGDPHAIFFGRTGWLDLDPRTGAVRSQFRHRARIAASVNAATPLVRGDEAFISSSYNTGAVLAKIEAAAAKTVWTNDESLSNHFNTAVVHKNFMFGLHGRQEEGPALRCVEWHTGRVKWSREGERAGALILVGDRLLYLRDDGRLDLLDPTADAYRKLADVQLGDGTFRALPALADGLFLARDEKKLLCLDLRTGSK